MIREVAGVSRLLFYPARYRKEAERGDGRLVVVIPWLFGSDLYLEPLRAWLGRIGYTAIRSTITLNAGCPLRLRDQVLTQIANWLQRKPGPLALIGHCRGGAIGWSNRRPKGRGGFRTWQYWALRWAITGSQR
jgi:hypothetical protein